MPWGARQEVDYTHPAFRFHAERVIRKIVSPLRRPPRGHRVPGRQRARACCCSTTTASSSGSSTSCATRYGDVETLNEAWGLVYWSHRLSTWADLWTPDGNCQPQYDLAWRALPGQADHRVHRLAGRASSASTPGDDQFVTTCISYERPAVDDADLTRALDVTAGNPYYAMQDALGRAQHERHVRRAGPRRAPGACS